MQTDTIRLRELTLRYNVKRDPDGREFRIGHRLNNPRDCASVLRLVLEQEPCEVFGILCLSTRHDVLAYHEVGRGTLDTVLIQPREVFKAAVLANAAAIVLAHNHPSGDPMPSQQDCEVTARLHQAGLLLGIEVLDHIVIGDGRFVSFRDLGRL